MVVLRQKWLYSGKSGCIRVSLLYMGKFGCHAQNWLYSCKVVVFWKKLLYSGKSGCLRTKRLVWFFAINRTTILLIYNCSELVCAIVDLGIVGLSVMCAHYGHNLFIYL